MNSDTRFIAISQRVVELSDRGETRDCLDQAWSAWVQSLGFLPLPVPNKIASVREFLNSIPLAGIILSGGNNLALPVYAGEMNGKIVTDAFESRDQTEQALVDFSLQKNIPVLGCCRGMQFLQACFGGGLSSLKNSTVNHVAKDHQAHLVEPRFQNLAGTNSLTVNSFHNFGIEQGALAAPLVSFAVADDSTVEGFFHHKYPIVGIMWHPERRNSAAAFDLELASRLFNSDSVFASTNDS